MFSFQMAPPIDSARTGSEALSSRLNIYNCTLEYIRSMIDRVPGLKVLLLDSETAGIISLVYSQSQILEKEVFLVERIDSASREPIRHLKAICFIRPTAQNLLKVSQELKQPLYSQYHLFFTNVMPHSELERIARCDEFELVNEVHEFFADCFVFNYNLFSLNIPSVVGLLQEPSLWRAYEASIFKRMLEGVFAALCAVRARPLIRYQKSSSVCSKLARQLQMKLNEESSLFDRLPGGGNAPLGLPNFGPHNRKGDDSSRTGKGTVLLIVDRRDDPITPLLNQWTYQASAMLHELIGIENNRVDLSKIPDVSTNMQQIVMSPFLDSFYEENHLANFGKLGYAVKQYVDAYQQQTKNTSKLESIEDMQRFVEIYPEYQKLSGNVSKHVTTLHTLSTIVSDHNLLDISLLEQELACHENMSEHYKTILEKIKAPNTPKFEQLRLVLLYALRYEGDKSVELLQQKLEQTGISTSQVKLIDALIKYAGANNRTSDLFQNKNLLALAKSTIQRSFKGTSNVFTQHRSLLANNIETLAKGKLKESSYPFLSSSDTSTLTKEKPAQIIVFLVGGATYEEAREVSLFNAQGGCQVLLGASTLHNSRSFLADVAQLTKGDFDTKTSSNENSV
ncbi:Sec1 family protein [Cardiosporidium cionae]|uniref:Sec1 family protein n=1 Tax=Cardiosporidium cionae TaxID=476202 RepID=A0ABQ7J7A6_9APIC|nr:Sec1 family protein [Cardiosporidium cionae]|eukprot:KAF8819828.1 Sec1 family protein [Cardiosporidium cionae]